MNELSGLANIGSFVGGIADAGIGILNYQNQKNAFKWQKEAQQKTWDREDNAIQRRAADLKAAGLSPVLAAGQGASSGSPIKLEAPQLNAGYQEKALMAMQAMTQKAVIHKTLAETQLANTTQRTQQQQLANLQIEELNKTQEYLERKRNIAVYENQDVPSDAPNTIKTIAAVKNALTAPFSKFNLNQEPKVAVELRNAMKNLFKFQNSAIYNPLHQGLSELEKQVYENIIENKPVPTSVTHPRINNEKQEYVKNSGRYR